MKIVGLFPYIKRARVADVTLIRDLENSAIR